MATSANAELERFAEELNRLYAELRATLAAIPPARLGAQPTSGGWTPTEDLAHVAEMLGYWSGEIERFRLQPGASFGRVASNLERIQFIEAHTHDTPEQLAALLENGYGAALALLRRAQPTDLETTGQHVKFGPQTVRQAIQEWLIDHLDEHVKQLQAIAADVAR
ncbi:MAG TPA: DinB family protein [Ktedonobacterales bacterium]|nr:DinB family protein [Ktedonobacterales bacterium]